VNNQENFQFNGQIQSMNAASHTRHARLKKRDPASSAYESDRTWAHYGLGET
jgi:hypothetical protein